MSESIQHFDPDGTEIWHRDGERHREDGPAYRNRAGTEMWFINGLNHRVGAPAIIWSDGDKEWYQHGKLHRLDGPAFESDNDKYYAWYNHGRRHRIDGPAVIMGDEKKWFIHGFEYDSMEWLLKLHEMNANEDG